MIFYAEKICQAVFLFGIFNHCHFSLSIPCLAVATSSARMANIDTARCSLEVSDQSVAANARVTGKLGAESAKLFLKFKNNRGTVGLQ